MNDLKTLIEAVNCINENEVPVKNRILLITPTLLNLLENLDTTKNRAIIDEFSKIIKVTQKDFCKYENNNINFMII